MFSARFTRQQGIPVVTVVAGTVALATLTAACGASGSSSSAAALSAAATEHASAAARAVSTASAGVGKAAGASKAAGAGKAAGSSKAAGGSKLADPGKTVAASGSAGGTRSAGAAGKPAGTATPAGAGKLTGANATALLSKAVANTQAASSVQVTGQAVPTGSGSQTESFDLTLVRNAGCEGAVTISPTKSFKVVEAGGYIWMMPSDAYYASMHMSRQNMAKVENKYIKMKATDTQAGDLATVCTFPGLLGQLDRPAGTAFVAVPTTSGANPGYRVTEAGQHGVAFVAKAPAPLLLQISDLRPEDGSITFAGYDVTSAITIPGAAETIDETSD